MRDALVPIFGESGALIVQYIVTVAVILGLIVLVVWLLRRFGKSGIAPTARGRLPRLAVVDALAVDTRRRLLLVRRDNVEHLLLIGGPSDIVVEPSIVRTRVTQRPGQAPASRTAAQSALNAPQPAPPPPPERSAPASAGRAAAVLAPRTPASGADDPIPFPPRRAAARQIPRQPQPGPSAMPVATEPEATPEPKAEPRPPLRARPALQPPAPPQRAERPPPEPEEPAQPQAASEGERHGDSPFAPPEKTEHPRSAFAPGDDHKTGNATAAAPPSPEGEEPRRPPPLEIAPPPEDESTSVSELEEDMARLLGQISPRRSG